MSDKRFYWIKLKTDFFNQEAIDFLMSQENGCEYIVLYQMLCLKTANNDGIMATQVGEMIVPYDVKKIVRDTKYFDTDTVIVALELFKKIGLIYEQEDGLLKLANYDEMVGSESASKEAIKKREYRLKKRLEDKKGDKKGTNCPTEIEYRDKSIDIDIDKEKEKKEIAKRFIPPSIEEVKAYCIERNNNIDAEQFVDFYESKNWMVGKNKMKDWKACVRTWEKRESSKPNRESNQFGDFPQREVDNDELERRLLSARH
jgi:predicted phage replisome organizer